MKKYLLIIAVILLALPASWYLLGTGYFNMHDDLQVMRIFEMEKCFRDGQIPCRWAPDMAWGYGQGMFNYYSAFPYYLGVLIRIVLPLSIMGTVRALFLISLVASGVGMYFLVEKLWGRAAGVLASVLYVYAPYHALDIYVRGALSESFSLAILPFLWHGLYLLIEKSSFKRLTYVSFCVFVLLTTHNISTMIYVPLTLLWVFYLMFSKNKFKSFKDLFLAAVFGFGLAAFFILPVIFETKLVQSEFFTVDYLHYVAHFVTVDQLFINREWGFGPSIWGPEDDISFQIGWPHWWLFFPALVISYFYIRNKGKRKSGMMLLGLAFLSLFFAFLNHGRSTFIWKMVPVMAYIQFPWRFLGPLIFTLSFLGAVVARPKYFARKLWIIILLVLIIVLNVSYFEPWNRSYEIRDDEKLSGIAWDLQRKSAILDYLPRTSPDAPKEAAPDEPQVINGNASVANYSVRSNSFFFDAFVYSDEAEFEIPVTYFPNWVVIRENEVVESYPGGRYGVITIKLPQGEHIIRGRFKNTPVRSVANVLTLISAMTLSAGALIKHNGKKFLWY